ncbi:hypothetical protein BJF83_21640 [Nocardiopsis sp. CNR-923]|uniref:hypothetical protein n=1 Tax=Nocardiopsis sp. CNR-923 TaxID=1904965 RepID=UPI00096177DD|nr:hypothetical protein [Nocardiopsis sp. CNR-923]OLT26327.1 hypothetical protein BJF83_21640 [Nocardiopsis sp. CNR-923]
MDDPTLARPYLLVAELRRTGRPDVQERHGILAADVTALESGDVEAATDMLRSAALPGPRREAP